jgi:hypothetical protein
VVKTFELLGVLDGDYIIDVFHYADSAAVPAFIRTDMAYFSVRDISAHITIAYLVSHFDEGVAETLDILLALS